MSKVRYTSRALDDIDALLLFMAEQNLAGRGAALSIASTAHAKVSRYFSIVADRSRIRSGHSVDSGKPVVAFYRVIDEDDENGATVEVLRIIDARRDLRTVFFTG